MKRKIFMILLSRMNCKDSLYRPYLKFFQSTYLDSQSIQGWKVSNSWVQSLSALVNKWLISWDFWDSLYRSLVKFLSQETFLALQPAFLVSQSMQGWKLSKSLLFHTPFHETQLTLENQNITTGRPSKIAAALFQSRLESFPTILYGNWSEW